MRIITVVLLVCYCALASAEDSDSIMVKKSDLPAELVAKLQKEQHIEQITEDLKAAKEWSGMGKEIGVAVNEGLKAVTEQTASFSKTDVGRLTMFLIAWKVMAKDLMNVAAASIGTLVGIPMLIFINGFAIWIYRRMYLGARVVKSATGSFWARTVEYESTPAFTTEWSGDLPFWAGVIFWFVLFLANAWVIAGCIL